MKNMSRTEKIKKPVTNGVAKVPVVIQLEALECGAASLTMVLAYYNKWIPLEQVRSDCGVSRDGANAKNILIAARSYGMVAKGYRFDPQKLKSAGRFPCIIHWNFNHFVVLDGFKNGKVFLNDPARGAYSVTEEVFDESFTGIVLMLEPGEDFEPSGRPKSMFAFAKKRFKGTGAAFAFVILTTIISSLLGIIKPGFSRVFLDRLLTGENPDWTMPFIIGLTGLTVIELIVQWINTVYSLRISGKMDVVGRSTYMWKVLRLPMDFYSQRMAGDIVQRADSNAGISETLVNTFAPLVLNAGMMIFYLAVMLKYSVLLTLVGLVSIVLNTIMSRVISAKRVNTSRIMMRDAGKLAGTTVSGIEMIETIKASGAEESFFARWAGYQASVNAASVKFSVISKALGLIPSAVTELTNLAVTGIGIYLTICGEFTVGMVLAFQGFLSSFMSPASLLISAGQSLQEMRTEMERIEDVIEYPDDPICAGTEAKVGAATGDGVITDNCDGGKAAKSGTTDTAEVGSTMADNAADDTSYSKLSGQVELKNITFGYSRLGEPLIENFSMSLKQGSKVAFVGSSGCGKSTLSKLISGLYSPWQGEILFDGRPIGEIDRNVFTSSLAVVDQDIILFEDTIANNIRMWDNSIEDFEIIMAARDAQIHSAIIQREGGYDYRISEGGKDFSGGERQRLEIARVLAQDPTIIILDEATSALDAKTEQEVVASITARGITCIVIAHRLSTIRDCDEIIVLDHGRVVERGTHEELYALDGFYTQLVSSD